MGKYDVGLPENESRASFMRRARENLWNITEPYDGKNAEYAERVRSMRDLCLKALDAYERDYKVAMDQAHETLERQLTHERAMREQLEKQITDRRRADEGLAEVWNDDPHDRRVTFKGRSAKIGHGVIFNIGQLETLVYRSRLGGGLDTTDITFAHGQAEAQLLAPENVVDLSGDRDDFEYTSKDLQPNRSDGVMKKRELPVTVVMLVYCAAVFGVLLGFKQLVDLVF